MNMLQKEIEIKRLLIENATDAAKIEKECLGNEAWSETAIAETMSRNGCYFGAFVNGALIGHGGFTFAADEGYITNISVLKSFRRNGVGRAVLDELCRAADEKKLSFLSLEVRESNLSARALYEKCGFKELGVRPKFYSKPVESAIIMTKYFKEEKI